MSTKTFINLDKSDFTAFQPPSLVSQDGKLELLERIGVLATTSMSARQRPEELYGDVGWEWRRIGARRRGSSLTQGFSVFGANIGAAWTAAEDLHHWMCANRSTTHAPRSTGANTGCRVATAPPFPASPDDEVAGDSPPPSAVIVARTGSRNRFLDRRGGRYGAVKRQEPGIAKSGAAWMPTAAQSDTFRHGLVSSTVSWSDGIDRIRCSSSITQSMISSPWNCIFTAMRPVICGSAW